MKKVHIISHSHWDREWYMPYEQHHMRLVELIDDLIELFEKDPEFKSFHLDGQIIALEDYLEVRPEKRAVMQKLVKEGRLKVGPFYILQDDFLTTSESNARNMLLGAIESRKWTEDYVRLGYFPDTFGNMGQTPQLMKEIGIEAAAFGRGVKPTGFGNQVFDSEKYSSNFSELNWEGPDQSNILGILFANWYCNGKEIPTDSEKAKQFWDKGLAATEKYAATDQLLFMNGCDHQPVQKDLSEAIRVANELFPDIEFIHSDFDTYLEAVKDELPDELSTVKGELTSQETDGWTTLANTASARVYLKQENTQASKLLEEVAEPLSVFAAEAGKAYPSDQLNYAWKLLMQNQPHDSICGCSVDEVHAEMMTRYHKTEEVAKYVAEESLIYLEKQINTAQMSAEDSIPFIIFNTSGSPKQGLAEIELAFDQIQIDQSQLGPAQAYHTLSERRVPKFRVISSTGEEIPIHEVETRIGFAYDLPKDSFRKPYMKHFVKFTLNVEKMRSYSWKTFRLELTEGTVHAEQNLASSPQQLENKFLKVAVNDNGTVAVMNKTTGEVYSDLLLFEDCGDVGNEYVFRAPEGERSLTTADNKAELTLLENNSDYAKVEILHHLEIPVSADEQLKLEQLSHVDYVNRRAKRSKETAILAIRTVMTMTKDSDTLDFVTSFDNQMRDHRLRALFNTGKQTREHFADSIFEVVKRENKVSSFWKNPENPQHTHAFVNIHDERGGLTVSNFGLNEYETSQDGSCIKITLLRAVGELGDWGYFPTPEAQCIGKQEVHYGLTFHAAQDFYSSLHEAFSRQVPFTVVQADFHEGDLPIEYTRLSVENPAIKMTALKQAESGEDVALRLYNLSDESQALNLKLEKDKLVHDSNLLEEDLGEVVSDELDPYQIKTLLLKDE